MNLVDTKFPTVGKYVLVSIVSFFAAASVLLLDLPVILSHFVVDDSFYYLEIARNIALGRGITFDGLHQTNGFQPLFQILIVPVFWITTESVHALYLVKAMEAILLSATSLLLFEFTRKLGENESNAWLALLMFFLPASSGLPFNKDLLIAMESGVNALMLLLLFNMWLRIHQYPQRPTGFYLLYGLVIGLTFLARLDNIFLIVGIALLHIRQVLSSEKSHPIFGRLLVAAAISLLVAGAYLTWNLTYFGHLVPISGRVLAWRSAQKSLALLDSGWLPWLENTFWFFTHPRAIAILPVSGLAAIPAVLLLQHLSVRKRGPLPEPSLRYRPFLFVLWSASAVKIAYYAIFEQYSYNAKYWYYVPEAILLTICSAYIVAELIRNLGFKQPLSFARTAALGVIAISALMILNLKPTYEWELASYQALSEISERVPPNALIGAKDAGLLGYFLPNPVINLDGLVNDEEFFRYQWAGRVGDYILNENIAYLTNLAEPGPQDIIMGWMGNEDLELIYRSEDAVSQPEGWVYKLYRVTGDSH